MSDDECNAYVFFDIQIGDEKAGRIIIELYKNTVPKTVENFRQFCTGEAGTDKNDIPLTYKGTKFHRVFSQFMIQGGNVVPKSKSRIEGVSIYGGAFEDENFKITHDQPGRVGMANNGPNTNYSHSTSLIAECPHLDTRNVVFGQVIKGLGVVREIAEVSRDDDGNPLLPCTILACGEITDGVFGIEENDCTSDHYPPYPEDCTFPTSNLEGVVYDIKESGNYFFNKQDYTESGRKYRKVIRYIDYVIAHCPNHERNVLYKMKTHSLSNLAAVMLKKGEYAEVVRICSEILEYNENNAKAAYRRGVTHLKLKEYDFAIKDFEKALTLTPNENRIEQLCATARKHRLKYIQHERDIYSKMFQKTN
ncbi:LOW QUALITY PROTEIN: peptidyl-prolyl cis-trans isomerase D-like [Atheta coriaria]|uniref:LOW QUALITY PROTEIN: peptidyl-prolyl cis-trans isomerase D-like n=1 Tax=Dalotia coriaria TaxID=877792 RepID=UPI0031F44D35